MIRMITIIVLLKIRFHHQPRLAAPPVPPPSRPPSPTPRPPPPPPPVCPPQPCDLARCAPPPCAPPPSPPPPPPTSTSFTQGDGRNFATKTKLSMHGRRCKERLNPAPLSPRHAMLVAPIPRAKFILYLQHWMRGEEGVSITWAHTICM